MTTELTPALDWAGIIVRDVDGSTYLIEIDNPPSWYAMASVDINCHPVEVPTDSLWRECRPGPTSGRITIDGHVVSACRVPTEGRPEWAAIAGLVRKAGRECTCPDLDTTTLAEHHQGKRSSLKGLDPGCPQHGRAV